MDAQDTVNAIYLKSTGKTATFPFTSTKGTKILGLMNFYQDRWSKATGVDWISLYNPMFSLGAVTATDTFDLDTSTIRKLSQQEGDNVRIIWPNDTGTINSPNYFTDYELVPADRMKTSFNQGKFCSRQGATVVFNRPFDATDPEFGGTLYVPCYTFVQPLVNPDDQVVVDDPSWLILICSAEYVRTDVTRLGQYPNLLAEANDCFARMMDDNSNDQNTDVTADWNPSPYNPSGIQWWQDM